MKFSTLVLTMYVDCDDQPEDDERILRAAIEQSIVAAKQGFNPFFTEHHFRGPWHSSPMQFAAYLVPQIPEDCWLGFAVLSTPYYHPVRLVESMNLLDQLTRGRALFGVGSGFPGIEPMGMGIAGEHHGSSRAGDEALDIMQHLWNFKNGDPEYKFETEAYWGSIVKRPVPAPYRKLRPTLISVARRPEALSRAAQNGWPAFLGVAGDDAFLVEQLRTYRRELAAAQHHQDVIDECLQWCTYDLFNVVVADTDAQAAAASQRALAERDERRRIFAARNTGIPLGPAAGDEQPVNPASSSAALRGVSDMNNALAGNPDTVARRIQQLADLGVNHVLVRFLGEWTGSTRPVAEQSMRLFSEEILPRFASVAPLKDPLATSL